MDLEAYRRMLPVLTAHISKENKVLPAKTSERDTKRNDRQKHPEMSTKSEMALLSGDKRTAITWDKVDTDACSKKMPKNLLGFEALNSRVALNKRWLDVNAREKNAADIKRAVIGSPVRMNEETSWSARYTVAITLVLGSLK
jgi:hypothetical protein